MAPQLPAWRCRACGGVHHDLPDVGFEAPAYYQGVPDKERAGRCRLTSDTCIVDNEHYFVRCVLELPIHGQDRSFGFGVWSSLSRDSFRRYADTFGEPVSSHAGPFFGWFSSAIAAYPDTLGLKCKVHLRDHGERPRIELEPADHPLAVEQREGISLERAYELVSLALCHKPG